jgi:phosphatidylglycerophosphatase C
LAWHRQQGHDVVIVSASPEIYVRVIGEALDVTGALGTRLTVDTRGKLSGHYLGRNCRGAEKSRRLHEWIKNRYPQLVPTTYAYGNSRGDRRLLSSATFPYDAGKLGPWGSLREFPRLTAKTPPR